MSDHPQPDPIDALLAQAILDVPDFPKPGIVFKDLSPVASDPIVLHRVIGALAERWKGERIGQIVGVESRGFVFGAALAYAMNVGLTLIRKPGKLPRKVVSASYDLEYGSDTVEMHADALGPIDRVLLIDDLLATGGTAAAAAELISKTGAKLAGIAFVVELDFLGGRAKLPEGVPVQVLHHVK